MTRVSKRHRQTTAISLFSVTVSMIFLMSGCGSTKRVIPPKQHTPTLEEMQETYEHLPKPVSEIPPSISAQQAEYNRFLRETFEDIDRYKNKVWQSDKRYYRYGKNKTSHASASKTKTPKADTPPLYPDLPSKRRYKDPLGSAL